MLRATREHKSNGGQLKRDTALSRIRCLGARPVSVIRSVFHGGRTTVKTLERGRIKEIFNAIAYDLYQMFTLETNNKIEPSTHDGKMKIANVKFGKFNIINGSIMVNEIELMRF